MGNKMTIEAVVEALDERNAVETLRQGWDASMASLPQEMLPFLVPEAIQKNLEACGLDAALGSELLQTAEIVESHAALRPLAWHLYQQLFKTSEGDFPGDDWPELANGLGDRSGIFYLLVALSIAPLLKQRHAKQKIPLEITRNTSKVVQGFCLNYKKGHEGRPGICKSQIAWMQKHVRGQIFRLGRLEYYIAHFGEEYSGGCAVYRHKTSCRVQVLAREGALFDAQGRFWSYKDVEDKAWTATLKITDSEMIGFPISPAGIASETPITLSSEEWDVEMDPQSWVLSMHIPNGGRLTPEVFEESMQRAFDFFETYFPEKPLAAMICRSWLYGEMLEEILPPTTNIVMNIQELYRWASHSESSNHSLWFIFCQQGDKSNVEGVTATSRLEQAILDHVRSGKVWREGSVFFLKKDLSRFGTQFYRSIS